MVLCESRCNMSFPHKVRFGELGIGQGGLGRPGGGPWGREEMGKRKASLPHEGQALRRSRGLGEWSNGGFPPRKGLVLSGRVSGRGGSSTRLLRGFQPARSFRPLDGLPSPMGTVVLYPGRGGRNCRQGGWHGSFYLDGLLCPRPHIVNHRGNGHRAWGLFRGNVERGSFKPFLDRLPGGLRDIR